MAHKNGNAMSCNIIKTDDNNRQKDLYIFPLSFEHKHREK